MLKVEVLGTGCAKCKQLARNAEAAVAAAGVEAEVEKVEDIAAIVGKGVMVTPALALGGAVKVIGRVASVQEIEGWLGEAAE